jgi:hypothetical protein
MTEVEGVKTNRQQKALKRAAAGARPIGSHSERHTARHGAVECRRPKELLEPLPLLSSHRRVLHAQKRRTLYQDLGANHFDNRAKGKQVLQLLNRLRNLGFAVQITPRGGIVQDLSLVRMSTRLSSARDSSPAVPAVLG